VKADAKEQQQSAPSTGRLETSVVPAPNKNGGEDQRWLIRSNSSWNTC